MSIRTHLYKQILKTYWQRPLILLLTGIAVLLFLVLALGRTGGNVMQVGARPHAPGLTESIYTAGPFPISEKSPKLQTLRKLLEHVDPAEIRSLRVVRVKGDDSLPDLSPFQNLVYLYLTDYKLSEGNVQQICQLPKLDALVLMGSTLPPGALQRFGAKVSQLEISATALESHTNEISRMSNVKLLALHLLNASPELLEHVTQIPQLLKLTLISPHNAAPRPQQAREPQAWDDIDLSKAQIKLLRNTPTLKEVYANWFLMKHLRGFDESELLPVRALPIAYSKSKLEAIMLTVFLSALLFSILALQLWALFVTPAAKLIPDYLVPQRRLAVLILATGSFFLTLALMRYDMGMLPAVSIILLLPAAVGLFSVAQLSHHRYRQWLILPLMPLFFLFFPPACYTIFKEFAAEAIWYFQGHQPGIALTTMGIEALTLSWVLRKLPAITEMSNENFLSMPALSPWDKTRAQQAQWPKPGRFLVWFLDRGTRNLPYSEKSTWQMIQLWRRGNAFRPSALFWFLGMILLFSLLVQGSYRWIYGAQLFTHPLPLIGILFSGICSIGIVLPAFAWWQRRKSLESESLRPVSRQSLVKQLYLSLAFDHFFLVISFLVLLSLFTLDTVVDTPRLIILMLLVGLAAPLWIMGTNATVFVFKQTWMIAGSMLALYTLAGTVAITIVVLQWNPQSNETLNLQALFIFALIAIPGALSLNVFMYRAALKNEWG